MAKKRLTKDQINQMKNMVVEGISPEDMAKHFNIAISSVHNYKKRFKDEGLTFPTVRGKRPSGDIEKMMPQLMKELDDVESKVRNMLRTDDGLELKTQAESESSVYKLIVKNKLIEIRGDITNVILKKDSIEIIV